MELNTFLSKVTKPELCGTDKYFHLDSKGKWHAVCPIAKAAVKRGYRHVAGRNLRTIAKKFGLDYNQAKSFTWSWDSKVKALKGDHGKATVHEMRVAFKQAIEYARPFTVVS